MSILKVSNNNLNTKVCVCVCTQRRNTRFKEFIHSSIVYCQIYNHNQTNIWTFHQQQKSTGKIAEKNPMQCHTVGTSTLTGTHVKI